MSDVFHEVDEQMRADRARAVLVKAVPWIVCIVAAVLISVLIYWGWSAYQIKAAAKASDAFEAGVKAYNSGDDAGAKKNWDAAIAAGSPNYKALALMEEGQAAVTAGKPAPESVGYYDRAAKAATSTTLRQLAQLEGAYVVLDSAPFNDVQNRLNPLTGAGDAYAVEAKEALAFAKMLHGDAAGARKDFNTLLLNTEATDNIKQRAQAGIAILDSGAAANMPAVVKAMLAMPTQPRVPQDVLNAIAQQQQQAQAQAQAAASGMPSMPGMPGQ